MNRLYLKRDLRHSFIDLYAGCGGMSLGMIQAGMKCLAAVEYGAGAVASYWYNLCYEGFSKLTIQEGTEATIGAEILKDLGGSSKTLNYLFPEPPDDYWTSDPEPSPCMNLFAYDMMELTPEILMEKIGIVPEELTAIVGGPPCQGFSLANSNRSYDDKRNVHPFRFIEFAEVIRPKIFIMENVPGMLTLGKKKGEKEGPFPRMIREAGKKAGYRVTYDVHQCAEYGVPQSRRRVLFVGVREDLAEKGMTFHLPPITHDWDYFNDPPAPHTTEPYVTVFEAIGDLASMHLSAVRPADAKHLPFGSMERVGTPNVKRRSKDDDGGVFTFEDYHYYQDRFNGLFFARNHVWDISGKDDTDYSVHHIRCLECEAFNLKVRKKCHRCGNKL